MSKFNITKSTNTKTTNLAGGEAYGIDFDSELISIIFTSFAGDQYYRDGDDTIDRVKQILSRCNTELIAKATVLARTQFGMRSITHVVASELSFYLAGKEWAKEFYSSVINRPDDISEIISYHLSRGYKITNAMKKGFATALNKFTEYQLAKYKMENKSIKLVDILNLVHPKPTEKTSEPFRKLMKGELKSFDTWESELVEATQGVSSEGKVEAKEEVWERLIKDKKIGYMALLKNLRNIIESAPKTIDLVCEALVNQEAIKKSLVLPFRFYTAYNEINKLSPTQETRKVMKAINNAIELSVENVPSMEGDTVVVLDVSGSMVQGNEPKSPHITGAILTALMNKKNGVDVMAFAGDAIYLNIPQEDTIMTVTQNLIRSSDKGGTNFVSIFQRLNKKYDRIIILSDMQGWMEWNVQVAYEAYKASFGCDPSTYFFDLAGYGTIQLPQKKVFLLAGFSDKILAIMPFLERGKDGLRNYINGIYTD